MSTGPLVALQVLGPSTGGIRVHVAALAEGLRRRGVDAPVLGPPGVLDGLGPQAGVVPVPAGLSPVGLWRARRALRPWLAATDLVHAHGLKAGWACIRGRPRRPVVLTLHNVVLDEGRSASARVRRRLEREVLRQVDRVVVPTRRMAAELTAIPPSRVRVVAPVAPAPRPVRSPAEIRAGWGVGDDTPVVVCVARLHPQKDLGTLLRAWAQVTRTVPEARLIVVGEGPARAELEMAVERAGLSGSVHLAGFSPHAVDELAAADVAVITSRWEAIPLVLVEAMLLGLPVVSTDVGLAPELLGSGEGGRCVPVGDAAAVAEALIDLLAAPPVLRRQVGETARRIAAELAGPEQLVGGVLDVYRELV
jgi:glycosyltransferase involved in cell wall biosynthesis